MLLKKTLKYNNPIKIVFYRNQEGSPTNAEFGFSACKFCKCLGNDDACILKYKMNINVDELKCGFDIFDEYYLWNYDKYEKDLIKTKYVAKEIPNLQN